MTDLLPARRPARAPWLRRGTAVAAAVAVAATLVCLHGGGPAPRLRVRPVAMTDIAVVDPATVAITVRVTNIGAGPALPTCILQARDPSGRHRGSGMFALKDPVGPGRTTSFTARLQVSGLGAQAVTEATAVCR